MRFRSVLLSVVVMAIVVDSSTAQPPGGMGRGPGGRQGRPNPMLGLLDADASGTLSADEIAAAADKLKGLDVNKDGNLDRDELRQAMSMGGPPRDGGPRGFGPGGRPEMTSSNLEKPPLAQDEAEVKILDTLQQMLQGERYLNVSPSDGRLLRLLAEASNAKYVVEIGTSTGESGLWLALALQSTGGKLVTHEIDPARAEDAKRNFAAAGVDGLTTVVTGDAHETVKQITEPIDLLFLDADKEGYIDYLEKLLPLVRPGGLIIAHNMNPQQADPAFVKATTENPQLESMILLKEGTGVGVTLKKR
jgi:caffeoyl-CoA O-methyltransferase